MSARFELRGSRCTLRAFRMGDVEKLAEIAGDPGVSRWMTARFPHPYSLDDARNWVALAAAPDDPENLAIDVDGNLAGGVGIMPGSGESVGVAEFGYWLGRAYWGRGIATDAAGTMIAHAFGARKLRRLEANVFAPNLASARVLEKCGFVREAVCRQALTERDGSVVDGWLYALLEADWHPGRA